ncbi:MAG: hypothetical protein RL346_1545 [Verrucomicrobiota bacterium]|jgi:autotransporter family porin
MKPTSVQGRLLAAACLLLVVSSVHGQIIWDGSESNLWNNGDNWVGGVAPINANSITFSGTTNQTNTNNAGITSIGTLTLSNGGWDIGLGASAVTMNAITATGSSTLTGSVTFANGSPRTITLNGTNTTLDITGQLKLSRSNNVLDLQVNGAGNTLRVGSLTMDVGSGNKTISGTGNVTVTGAVTENMTTGSFVKAGSGTLTLNGSYTSNNTTIVSGGTLFINGNASNATGAFNVNGGNLGGIGTIGGATTIGNTSAATLAAGHNATGTLTFANTLTLGANATTIMEINGLAGAGATGGHDFINLTGAITAGTFTYGGALNLDIGTLFTTSASWNLYDFTSETGTFTSITLADQYSGSLLDGNTDGVWELVDGTHSWTFTESSGVLNLTIIPEPSTLLLGSLGACLFFRRRKN